MHNFKYQCILNILHDTNKRLLKFFNQLIENKTLLHDFSSLLPQINERILFKYLI